MSEEKPRLLARFVQDSLESIDRMDSSVGERVRKALKPETLGAIEQASSIGWIDVEVDVELTEAFFQVAGSDVAQEALRKNMASTCESPVLRSLVDGSLALFGTSPSKILRWTPKVWWLLSRDCGKLELVQSDEQRATIEMTEIPPSIAASRNYLLGMAAAITGAFDVIRMPAECNLERPEPGRVLFQIEWRV